MLKSKIKDVLIYFRQVTLQEFEETENETENDKNNLIIKFDAGNKKSEISTVSGKGSLIDLESIFSGTSSVGDKTSLEKTEKNIINNNENLLNSIFSVDFGSNQNRDKDQDKGLNISKPSQTGNLTEDLFSQLNSVYKSNSNNQQDIGLSGQNQQSQQNTNDLFNIMHSWDSTKVIIKNNDISINLSTNKTSNNIFGGFFVDNLTDSEIFNFKINLSILKHMSMTITDAGSNNLFSGEKQGVKKVLIFMLNTC